MAPRSPADETIIAAERLLAVHLAEPAVWLLEVHADDPRIRNVLALLKAEDEAEALAALREAEAALTRESVAP